MKKGLETWRLQWKAACKPFIWSDIFALLLCNKSCLYLPPKKLFTVQAALLRHKIHWVLLSAPHKERQLSNPLSFSIYCLEPLWRVGEEMLLGTTVGNSGQPRVCYCNLSCLEQVGPTDPKKNSCIVHSLDSRAPAWVRFLSWLLDVWWFIFSFQ